MATVCRQSIQLCAIRIAELGADGAPVVGAGNMYATDSAISLAITRETTDGQEFELLNGCGSACVQFKDCDKDKRFGLTVSFCALEDELFNLMTGGTAITSGSDTIGMFERPIDEACLDGVSLEFWSKRWNTTEADADLPYWHWGIPKTTWRFGDWTLENGVLVASLVGEGFPNSGFLNGPENDWPTDFPADTLLGRFAADDFPEVQCGAISTPASSP